MRGDPSLLLAVWSVLHSCNGWHPDCQLSICWLAWSLGTKMTQFILVFPGLWLLTLLPTERLHVQARTPVILDLRCPVLEPLLERCFPDQMAFYYRY